MKEREWREKERKRWRKKEITLRNKTATGAEDGGGGGGEDETRRINLFPSRARDSVLKIARERVYNRIAIVPRVVVDPTN